MRTAYETLVFANRIGINLWLEENDKLKYKATNRPETEATLKEIVANKIEIIELLKRNNVYNEAFQLPFIYKCEKNPTGLSFAQERLWFVEQYEGGTNAYHVPRVYQLRPGANVEAIKFAISKIVARHEVLRSTIKMQGDETVQYFHEMPLNIEKFVVNSKDDLLSIVRKDINKPFDLTAEYPIRAKLYFVNARPANDQLENSTDVFLLINIHHIATDGWSMDCFQRELIQCYAAFVSGHVDSLDLPMLPVQYKDYAVWQREYFQGEVLQEQIDFWVNKLTGFENLNLQSDYSRPKNLDYHGKRKYFSLDKQTSSQLQAFCKEHGTTLHVVLLSILSILLSKYTGQCDIVTGSPIANRHYNQIKDLIGYFVNTQVNRIKIDPSNSCQELFSQVHDEQAANQQNQDLPFEKLVDLLQVERDSSRHPIFQVMFGVQSFGKMFDRSDDKNGSPLFLCEDINQQADIAAFDISLFLDCSTAEFEGMISYKTSLFSEKTIEQLIKHYRFIVEQILNDPGQAIKELTLLSSDDYQQLVYQWNKTSTGQEPSKSIIQRFIEQVERTPERIALVYGDYALSYHELNDKANQLAAHIQNTLNKQAGLISCNKIKIGLLLDRSPEMIIAMLAILKCGAAYVPMDPDAPQQRLEHIVSDTEAALVLTLRRTVYLDPAADRQHLYKDSYQAFADKLILIDLDLPLYSLGPHSIQEDCNPDDLAYVIYTSGTTGNPKGVLISHANISSLIFSDFIQVSQDDTFLFLSSPVFDAATFEIWMPLLHGSKLVIPADTKLLMASPETFGKLLDSQNISTLWLTKTLFENLYLIKPDLFKHLQYLLVGGEALNKEIINGLLASEYRPKNFLNGYGPTESTTFTCVYTISKEIACANVPIGKPIAGRTCYVLDSNKYPVPIGVVGELYIGGAGLARGYLNNPELTADKFVFNNFCDPSSSDRTQQKLYKTGDLVRWMPDGCIEYIGRKDGQVKIRGYRIELSEIENTLQALDGINQAVVLVKTRDTKNISNKILVAYYTTDKHQCLSYQTILEHLAAQLPDYMIPNSLIELDEFPVTMNGKLNTKALPEPGFADKQEYISPDSDLERSLCQIYSDILGISVDEVSVRGNFFSMGGNSILSMQLKHRLNQLDQFASISIADLFKFNTVQKLMQSIDSKVNHDYQLQNTITHSDDKIAIIGLSASFSGVDHINDLWSLVVQQEEGIRFYSKEQCIELGIAEETVANPDYVPIATHVRNTDKFDPQFWGMSPNEAKLLDPQIRKFIEHCWVALESSGYIAKRKSNLIGIFAGSGTDHYFQNNIVERTKNGEIDLWEASVSNRKDSLTTKAAYFLGLTGPATSINTACSTGLVSIIEACRNLQLGTCNMALAGGVSLTMPEEIGYTYTEGMIMSRDGHCRPFDRESSGTIPASGVAVVLLKRLSAAIKDNDEILAVVSGYASNNDGDRKTSYTAPSLIGQSECIINAHEMAHIRPGDVDYIECHGTATRLGDSIEVQALKEAFQYRQVQDKRLNKTVLGAIKANLGHTDAASGVAGVIKVVQMLKHETIPGQTNFSTASVELNLETTPFEIITQNRSWKADANKPRVAGVSSFGIGGTNAHIVIQDLSTHQHQLAPLPQNYQEDDPGSVIIPISAKSRTALEAYRLALLSYIEKNKDKGQFIQNLAFTLQRNREHYTYRNAYVAESSEKLACLIKNDNSFSHIDTEQNNKVVLMFPGQGTQYVNMARGLYENEPQFAALVDKCILIANQYLTTNVRDILFSNGDSHRDDINSTEWTQICLFIVEYSLARYLQLLDVKADAYMGHSIGEYVAATLSEIFSLEDAIKLVIARGQLMQSMQPGNMLAVKGKFTDLQGIVEAHACEVAVINSPEDSVISGLNKNIQALQSALNDMGMPSVILTTSHAYHSRMMDGAAHKYKQVLANVVINAPNKPFVTNLSGKMATSFLQTADYWCDQLRNTVRFAECIESISEFFNYKVTFIEVGVGQGLTAFVNKFKDTDKRKNIYAFNILPSYKGSHERDVKSRADLLAILWKNNQLDLDDLTVSKQLDTGKNLSDCPTYQFDLQKCWLDKPLTETTRTKLQLLDKNHWYSVPQWSTGKVLQRCNDRSLFQKAVILLRKDQEQCDIYTSLANACTTVWLDTKSSEYTLSGDCIVMNPENDQHFAQLQCYLANSDHEAIIHAASIDNSKNLESALSYGFYSLFLVRCYLLSSTWLKSLLILTNGIAQISEDDVINAANGTLVGAVRNIKHEFSHINTGLIDIGSANKNTASQIKQAFSTGDKYQGSQLFAIKFGKLWQETYVKINPCELESRNIIADGDVILMTGGMGGVALSLAKAISEKHKVTFILLSRNDIYQNKSPSEYIKQKLALIEQIKDNGSTVLTHAVDIGNGEHFNRALLDMLVPHQEIAGVIHTAGVEPLTPEQYHIPNVKRALAGKVYGLDNLLRCINVKKLKYLAFTSSLASILGDVNRIEYCAANSYLDYLAGDRQRFGNTPVVSINFPGWSDIGIVRNNEQESIRGDFNAKRDDDKLRALISLNAVQQYEGGSIFYDLVQQPYSQIVFSKLDLQLLEETLFKPLTSRDADMVGKVLILEEVYTEQEAVVAQLFSEVLGVEQLSVDDDFFRIGGNSILAIQLSHKISRKLDFDIKVADIFKYKTIRNILSSISTEDRIEIPKLSSEKAVLSFAQQRLWFIEQYEQGTHAYHIPSLYKFKSSTNVDCFKRAIGDIVVRHEVLRSVIHQDDNSEFGVQIVCNKPLPIEQITLSDRIALDTQIARDIAKPFDLAVEYPIRVKLYTLAEAAEQETILLVNMHHIATDGWSIDIFLRELAALYRSYLSNQSAELPPLPVQYKDFAQWQRKYLQGDVLQKQLDYWKHKLTGFVTLELPTDYQRPHQVNYKGGHQKFTLNARTSQAIKSLAKSKQTTVHTVLLTAFSILLSKLANQTDIVTGSPIANRHYPQIKDLIGLFINTQVNRVEVDPAYTYNQLIQHVHQDQVDGQQYQDVPFEKLVEELDVERDLSRHPIFQVMFGVQSFGQLDNSDGGVIDLPLLPYEIDKTADEISRFDIALFIDDSREQIQGYLAYKTSLFNEGTIAGYIQRFTRLLESLLQSPDTEINQFSLISQDECDVILHGWNSTQFDYPNQTTVNELFQLQVELNPDEMALVYRDRRLTYQELNDRSNALANRLRQTYKDRTGVDITPGTLIPLCFDRSLEMVVSILAVLKAGGGYVPIDPNYPQDRIDYILNDISAKLVLTRRIYVKDQHKTVALATPDGQSIGLSLFSFDFALIADLDESFYLSSSAHNLPQYSGSADIAYVIYTSGTTGRPKGVMVSHQSLIYYTHVFISLINVDKIKSAFLLNYCFDASLPTIFSGLLQSGTTFILDNMNEYTSQEFVSYLQEEHINTLRLTPSMLMTCKDDLVKYSKPLSLVLGGEPINIEVVNELRSNDTIKIFNQYGPTECTVGSTVNPISSDLYVQNIGKPYPGKRIYILDQSRQLCPIGQIGELYIGGEGLAKGYLNRIDLTEERFVNNPYASHADLQNGFTKLYKTGDLGRWLANGDIEYFGRNDDQIKLRGYRIELGEIESRLMALAGVKEACVVLHTNVSNLGATSKFLVAYYSLNDDIELSSEIILQKLANQLPEYMLPNYVMKLDAFPLTTNGKLDKKSLPKPDLIQSQHYVAPRSEYEQKICAIWQETLGLARVGVTDDFFRIGGDSISSIQVASRIRKIGLNCQVKNIFEYRTVERLFLYLSSACPTTEIKFEDGLLTGTLGLLPIQNWFMQQVDAGRIVNGHHWNQSFLVKVPELNQERLPDIIQQLVDYHDILRVRYTKQQHTWLQSYHAGIDLPQLKMLDVSQHRDDELDAILTDWQSHFDLHNGPLFQFAYLYGYQDSSARLFCSFHHLIVDSVSLRILIQDFKDLYDGHALERKGTSYRQWVNEVQRYPELNPKENLFWQRQVDTIPDYIALFGLEHEEHAPCFNEVTLNEDLTNSLLRTANSAYHTEINELLLTALVYALKDISDEDNHGITLEGHGRENISGAIDHSHTVGWFTSKFPVKLQVKKELPQTIKGIKHMLRSIPHKGIGFGAFVSQPAISTTYDFNDMPGISFNYLGNFDAAEGYWQVVNESSGKSVAAENPLMNIIHLNGMVNRGKLWFGIHSKLSVKQAEIFSSAFKQSLKTVIAHCCEQDRLQGYIDHPDDFNDFIPYEVVNEQIDNNPIFVLPPGGAGAESYYSNLVPNFSEQKLVLFNNYYDYVNDKKGHYSTDNLTFEKLAVFYVDYIKQLQAEGPYTLTGWSFGGILAFEIAKQLTALGDKINSLVLLDSYFNYKEALMNSEFTDVALFESNVNYQYQPEIYEFPFQTEIVLFKATKVDEAVISGVDEAAISGTAACVDADYLAKYKSIHAYYVNRAKDNHLSKVVKNAYINIIQMDASHNSWVSNTQVIQAIVDVINTRNFPDS